MMPKSANCLYDQNGMITQVGNYSVSEISKKILVDMTYLYEHSHPVIHADVSTENISISDVSGRKNIKIANFASAKLFGIEYHPKFLEKRNLVFSSKKAKSNSATGTSVDIHKLDSMLGNMFNIDR
jgi:serine/threonine protein kinase